MSGAAFLRIKKLKRNGIITVAARHNKREIQAEMGATGSIDPTRSHLNYVIAGPAAAGDVGQLAKDLMTAAGITKLRKDAVMGLEIVFSLPTEHAIDDRAYFEDCTEWASRYFGGHVLSSDVHKDEANDHCHVLLLPLIDGRMDGGRVVGNKQKLIEMQKHFHNGVAQRYGLSKAAAKLTGAAKQLASKAVLDRLRETDDKAMQSQLWATIRDVIESDPGQFLMALGMKPLAVAKKLRTVTQIMTSKGKGKNKEPISIDFASTKKDRSLCSVDFASKPAPLPPPKQPQHQHDSTTKAAQDKPLANTSDADSVIEADEEVDAPFVELTTRHRDSDQTTDNYNDDSGDYCPTQAPAPRRHRQAVNAALMALSSLSAGARLRAV